MLSCLYSDCECSAAGTVENSCRPDPRTGTCICKPGFTGDHCDTCAPGFYGLNCQGEKHLDHQFDLQIITIVKIKTCSLIAEFCVFILNSIPIL